MLGSAKRSLPGVLLLLGLALACSDGDGSNPAPNSPAGPSPSGKAPAPKERSVDPVTTREQLAQRGRAVYMANCSACHAADPSQEGSLGPPIAGSSHELLEARVLHNSYPEGYTPKRDSRAMVALPFLENELEALAAYLAP